MLSYKTTDKEFQLFNKAFDSLGYQWSESNREKAFLGWQLCRQQMSVDQMPALSEYWNRYERELCEFIEKLKVEKS